MIPTLDTPAEINTMTGTTITIGSLFIGMFIKLIDNGHVNPIVMEIGQLGAWSTAILVGAFTIRSYVKKDKADSPPDDH